MFHVICLETSEPVTDALGVPVVYATGAEAAARAGALSAILGKKHQPRPIKDTSWQEREAKRFEDGTYTRLPWDTGAGQWGWYFNQCKAKGYQHFAHVSRTHPGLIAYTQDAEKGARDIQTPIKPGRYLTQFFGDLLYEDSIRELACQFSAAYAPLTLKFADTEEEIERVYVNGPNSCMSHSADDYSTDGYHPVRVYAAGDLAVAYLCSEDGEEITARVLCWPAKKIYGRVYGDADRLKPLLTEQGYTGTYGQGYSADRAFEGAKLLRKENDDGDVICPYLDTCGHVRDIGKHLVLASSGDCAQQTNGLLECGPLCSSCEEHFDPDSEGAYISDLEETWCQSCTDNHAFYCDHTGNYYSDSNTSHYDMRNGETWCQRAFDQHGAECEATGTYLDTRNDDYVVLNDGTVWCCDHFQSHGFQCSDCGESFDADDRHSIANADCPEDTCQSCAENADLLEEPVTEAPLPIYKPRQGRDEHPNQLELPLSWAIPTREAIVAIRVGDRVLIQGSLPGANGERVVTRVDRDDPEMPIMVNGYWVRAIHILAIHPQLVSEAA